MNKSKPLFLLILFFAGFSLILGSAESLAKKKKDEFRPNWMELGPQNYPARVTRLTSQHSIDLQTNICYGKWCVGFPNKNSYEKEYPIALWWQGNQQYSRVIFIDPLTCTNDVMGEIPCYMILSWDSMRGYDCSVIAGKTYAEEGNALHEFDINCPNISIQ